MLPKHHEEGGEEEQKEDSVDRGRPQDLPRRAQPQAVLLLTQAQHLHHHQPQDDEEILAHHCHEPEIDELKVRCLGDVLARLDEDGGHH